MSQPLNESCFHHPPWKVLASGFNVEDWFERNLGTGTGGIAMPQKTNLRVGQRYFRFASSGSSLEVQLGGGWWVDFENFRKIRQFSTSHHYNLGYSARLYLALPPSWTRVDRLVSAILEAPLAAYTGAGKPAADQQGRWTPVQHDAIQQLYIPGLYVPDVPPDDQLYKKAFPSPTIEMILP